MQLIALDMKSSNLETDMKTTQIDSKIPNKCENVCLHSNPFDEEVPITTAANPFCRSNSSTTESDKQTSKDNNNKSTSKSDNILEHQGILTNESFTGKKDTTMQIKTPDISVQRYDKTSSNPFDSSNDDDITASPVTKRDVTSLLLSKKQMCSPTETNADLSSTSAPNKKEINVTEKTAISSTSAMTSIINKNGELFMKLKKIGFSDKFVLKALQINKNDFMMTLGWLRDEISGLERTNTIHSSTTGTIWKPPLITRISESSVKL